MCMLCTKIELRQIYGSSIDFECTHCAAGYAINQHLFCAVTIALEQTDGLQ